MAIHLGVFLVTLSGLVFEIALTRIFSATIWYHFAFVAISVALLGWGLGGFGLHAARRRFSPSTERAALVAVLYAASLPLSLWLIVRLPFLPERLAYYFVVSLIPFFLAGVALSMVFGQNPEKAGSLYFADLVGAASGALLVTPLLSWLGGERAVVTTAIFPLLAAACLSRRLAGAAAGLGVLVALGAATKPGSAVFQIRNAPTKGMYQHMAEHPRTRVALTGWNAYSRIDAVTGFPDPYLARLYIDSDAWTSVLRWDGRLETVARAREWFRALPFKLAPEGARTLVIGPGGGADVLVALGAGSAKVTAVELNPLMLAFVRRFGKEAGDLYDHPQVETVLSEGRTFVRRTDRRFDVILLGFVDSWAAVASGGLSLSENHLYTVEAFSAYHERLTPEGMLVILRWDVDIPRLVANAVALLGAEQASERLLVLLERRGTEKEPPQMIFALRKRPFTGEETSAAMGWEKARPVIVPGRHVEAPYADLLAGRKTLGEYVAEAPTRVDPVTDDRPFFFARQKPWGLPRSMSLAFLTILLPIALLCLAFVLGGRPAGAPRGAYAASVVYFAGLGFGFISLELSLLQHLTLLLGHPIFTLSLLLFSLLLFGGLGSFRSVGTRPALACFCVAGLGTAYALALPGVVPELLPLPLAARLALAVLLTAPLGFAMGMPFPRGLVLATRAGLPAPPFYWGLNGVLSVAGSVATMVVAVTSGFTAATLAGCACYLVSAAAARRLSSAAAA
jgi:predicted membrane-bound spermidine synthase